jgi:hypothetical protein
VVWARVTKELRVVGFTAGSEAASVQFFLMEALSEERPTETRAHEWLRFDEALSRATHDETRDLLQLAELLMRES